MPVPVKLYVADIPELLARWHPTLNDVDPKTVGSGSKTKRFWNCPKDDRHAFRVSPNTMTRKGGYGCSVCAGHTVMPGVNDFGTTHPELAREWDTAHNGISPAEFTASFKKKGRWICSNIPRHKFESTPKSRVRQGVPCPWCSNRLVEPGFNDLATLFPELVKFWDYEANTVSPKTVHPGSGEIFQWLCPENPRHRYTRSPNDFTNEKRARLGCGICSGKQCQKGENDCATTHPDVAAQFVSGPPGVTPETVTHGSKKIAIWQCSEYSHHRYSASFNQKTNGPKPKGCPYCAFKELDPGFNDLRTRHPSLVESFDLEANSPVVPADVIAGGTKKWVWKCPVDGHEWTASVWERNSRGCGACAGKVVIVGVNDLATKNPKLAAEWHPEFNGDLSPSNFTARAGQTIVWQCDVVTDHVWHAKISNRGVTGCPFCAVPSFKRDKPAIFYYLEEPSLRAAKVGITNVATKMSRLKAWEKAGWQIVKSLEDEKGFRIWMLEKQIKRWLRKERSLLGYLGQSEMSKMHGATETFELGAISVKELWAEVTRRWGSISKTEYQDYLDQIRQYENQSIFQRD